MHWLKFKRARFVIPLFLICIVSVLGVGAGKYLVVNEAIRSSDVCMAMSGPRYRFEYVIGLYTEGFCDELFIVGGTEGGTISYASKMMDFAVNTGVPATGIAIDETNIFSSYAELQQLRSFLEYEFTEHILVTIVTSGYHSRRTQMVWGWVMEDHVKLNIVSISRNTDIDSWLWWASSESRKIVSMEYLKIAFYFLRYRIPIPALNELLSSYDKIND